MTGLSNTRFDDELHEAVQSYGASVHPADRLGQIRQAVRPRPRGAWRRPWVLATAAAAATAVVVVGAVALTGPERSSGKPPVVAGGERTVTVYEVDTVGGRPTLGGRPWLYPEQVIVADTGDGTYDAVLALVGDGSDAGDVRWTGCPWGHLDSVQTSADAVTVTLAGQASTCDMDPAYAEAQVQQLAWTVRDAVGSDIPVVLMHGDDRWIDQPFRAEIAALSPILLDSPADGATVTSPVTVEGRGNTFEANVQWQVLSDDDVVQEGFETAGTMGHFRPFRFTVDLPAGDYTVRAFELSMEDGSLFAEDTRSFTVE